jgi:AbrB family looped-hinge helix DNA binding protein
MSATAKITSKGQIALPEKVRDILHLQEGGVVVFEQENDTFVIKPAESLLDDKGYFRGRAKHADADSVREAARTYVGRRAGKRRERP